MLSTLAKFEIVIDVTKYDRVMVYEFDRYNNGVIIVEESSSQGPKKNIGQRFPATNIPEPVYLGQPIRVIASVSHPSSKLQPAHIDLSQCISRGVSPIHLEYLRNMGVSASCSISLRVRENNNNSHRLWGLIICHHNSDKLPPIQVRQELELLSQVLSLRLELLLQHRVENFNAELQSKITSFKADLDGYHEVSSFYSGIITLAPQILSLLRCDGVVVYNGIGKYSSYGRVGNTYEEVIARSSNLLIAGRCRYSNCVSIDLDISRDEACCAVLTIPIADQGAFIILIRPDLTLDVTNLSNKTEVITTKFSSSKAWRVTSLGKGCPWESQDLAAANDLSVVLTELVLRLDAQRKVDEAHRQRDAAQRRLSDNLAIESMSKDRFLACLSHELRTPLTPVLLVLEALEEQRATLPSQMVSDVLVAKQSLLHEVKLMDDLLDVCRITKGKMFLTIERVNCHTILESTMSILKSNIEEKSISLKTNLCATNVWLQADPRKLQQVFLNLIQNSLKFTLSGGHIDIHTYDQANTLVIEVKDTGVGIEESMLKSIFDPFQQGGQDITRTLGGLRLGLSIVKGIVELHGGSVEAASKGVGYGSTITVTIPTRSETAVPNVVTPTLAPRAVFRSPSCDTNVLRVLLVEDNLATQAILSRALKDRLGHQVCAASSCKQALEFATSQRFDLLLSDIGLPDGTGLDLIRKVRHIIPDIVAIALSGFGSDEDQRQSLLAGFCRHITKPLRFSELRQAIEESGCLRDVGKSVIN